MSGVTNFDFLLGTWYLEHLQQATDESILRSERWDLEEFPATSTSAKQLDGRVRIEQYEATLPNGQLVLEAVCKGFRG